MLQVISGLNQSYQTYRFRTHGNLQSVERIMPSDLFHKYIKFSVVRNPWDRLVSEYEFFNQGSEVYQNVLKRRRHRWARDIKTFDEFVHAKAKRKDATQYYYLKNSKDALGVDNVLKQESLSLDFEKLCNRLDFQCQLTRYNTTQKRNPTASYFSKELNQFVMRHWSEDIELFGYQSPLSILRTKLLIQVDILDKIPTRT